MSFSQNKFAVVNAKKDTTIEDSKEKHLHLNRDFPVMVGAIAEVINKQFFIGSRFNWQKSFGDKKKHKFGVSTDFLFSMNSTGTGEWYTYMDHGDTVVERVYHEFYLWDINAQYDYYIISPFVRGFGLRIGALAGLSFQTSSFSPEEKLIHKIKAGFKANLILGFEYRWESNFGLFMEVSAGYYHFSKKLVYMPKYDTYLAAVSIGILYDFTFFNKR